MQIGVELTRRLGSERLAQAESLGEGQGPTAHYCGLSTPNHSHDLHLPASEKDIRKTASISPV
jgi:hypothetical protein